MPFKTTVPSKCFATYSTLKGLVTRVGSHVNWKIASFHECLVTRNTLDGFFTSMDTQVSDEPAVTAVCLSRYKMFLIRVDTYVNGEVALIAKCSATNIMLFHHASEQFCKWTVWSLRVRRRMVMGYLWSYRCMCARTWCVYNFIYCHILVTGARIGDETV